MRRLRLDDLLASASERTALSAIFGRGGVAAVPTETFYGLATEPTDEAGVARIRSMKGRDAGQPLPVVAADRAQLEVLGVAAPPATLDRFLAIWPAPLTVVLRLRAPIAASLGRPNLGVRIPAEPRLRRLLAALGPLTATSANRSGEPPLEDPDAVSDLFGGEIDVLVDGGRTPGGRPSTVVDATVEPPVVLRAGAFEWSG